MAQFLKFAELMYSRSIIRQPPIARTISKVPSVEPLSAIKISSAIPATEAMHGRILRRSSLQGMSTVSLVRMADPPGGLLRKDGPRKAGADEGGLLGAIGHSEANS